jgi:hypothetical protein
LHPASELGDNIDIDANLLGNMVEHDSREQFAFLQVPSGKAKAAKLERIAEPEPLSPLRVVAEPGQVPVGQIGIELSSGIRLTVDARFDADALARVLSVVGR